MGSLEGLRDWRQHRLHFAINRLADQQLNDGKSAAANFCPPLTMDETEKLAGKAILSIAIDVFQGGDETEKQETRSELGLLRRALNPTPLEQAEEVIFTSTPLGGE